MVIVPVGASVLQLATGYGGLDLLGGWMRPVMRPLFHVPGRASLDGLMSWLGSYSAGLYLIRSLLDEGIYTRREAFVIVTSFSTVSVGFVGVVASTLGLLSVSPVIVAAWFVSSYGLAALLARTWPTTSIPDTVVSGTLHQPEEGMEGPLVVALQRARAAPGPHRLLWRGLSDGLMLAASPSPPWAR